MIIPVTRGSWSTAADFPIVKVTKAKFPKVLLKRKHGVCTVV